MGVRWIKEVQGELARAPGSGLMKTLPGQAWPLGHQAAIQCFVVSS